MLYASNFHISVILTVVFNTVSSLYFFKLKFSVCFEIFHAYSQLAHAILLDFVTLVVFAEKRKLRSFFLTFILDIPLW